MIQDEETFYKLHDVTREDLIAIKDYLNIISVPIGNVFYYKHLTNSSWDYLLENPQSLYWYPIRREVIKELKKAKIITLEYKYKKKKEK